VLVSVITIVKHEVAHLRNLIRGVDRQTRPVDELVIVALGRVGVQAEAELASTPVTILHDPPTGYRPGASPKARDEGATIAVGDLLVFLDADIVPNPYLVERYVQAAVGSVALLAGPVVDAAAGGPDGVGAQGTVTVGSSNMAALGPVWQRLGAMREIDDPTDPDLAAQRGVRVEKVEEAVAYRQRNRRVPVQAWWDSLGPGAAAGRATTPAHGRRR
jgi:glycosyltransferase involved in cell wall biosynthesis